MSRPLVRILTAFALFSWLLVLAPLAVAQEEDKLFESLSDDEKLLVLQFLDEGTQAYSRGDFGEALEAYQQAFELFPHPEILYRLGLCYERMGNEELAVRYYRQFLQAYPEAEDRGRIERTIGLMEERMADRNSYLRIVTTPEGATIYLDSPDSDPLAKTPEQLSLSPGQYRIYVEKPGYQPVQEEVEVLRGQTVMLRLSLMAIEQVEEPLQSRSQRSLWQPLTGAALAGIGGWAVYRTLDHRRDYQFEYEQLQSWRGENVREGNEAEHQRRVDEVNHHRRRAITMGLVGGASLLGAAALTTFWLIDGSENGHENGPELSLQIFPSPVAPTLTIRGRF